MTLPVRRVVPGSRRPRHLFLTGVSALALLTATVPAEAGGLRDRGSASSAAAAAAAVAQAGAQAAAVATSQAMSRVGASLQAMRNQQAAARAAAQAAAASVPNGLAPGGLVVAPGATPSATNFGSGLWQGANLPAQRTLANGRTEVEVKQSDQKAILTWQSFNVGRETDLYFNQTAGGANVANWIALNRVLDPSAAPSRILGTIKAEGQVYVINRNGIIFGGTSQVNVGALVASSLSLSNVQLQVGINTSMAHGNYMHMPQFGEFNPVGSDAQLPVNHPNQAPRFTPGAPPGAVLVEAGAEIQSDTRGKIMLFAPHVSNAGRISAPDGQVLMAAGEQVWLSNDYNGVRGLDVAASAPMPWLINYDVLLSAVKGVEPWSQKPFADSLRDVIIPEMNARAAAVGYRISNTGEIVSERGNVTIQAREVMQGGVVLATTALNNKNGSIRLRAYSQGMMASSGSTDAQIANWAAGDLQLAPGSVTAVLPDAGDKSELELSMLADRYAAGRIELRGRLIDIQPRAGVVVPAGTISVVASAHLMASDSAPSKGPSEVAAGAGNTTQDGSRLYIDRDAYLSVAGLQDMLVPMERNFVEAELRINELRDSVLYRDSWLRGKKVIVDRRIGGTFTDGPMADVNWIEGSPGKWFGTPLADVTPWISVGKTDLAELSTTGGTIILKSGGALITRDGSILDVTGGSVRYTDGWSQTSKLVGADGRVYDISQATPDRVYLGLVEGFSRSHRDQQGRVIITETWTSPLRRGKRFEPGYTEGRAAGTIQMLAGEALILEGAIAGGVTVGERQAVNGSAPSRGTLKIGGGSDDDRKWSLGRLIVTDTPVTLAETFTAASLVGPEFFTPAPASEGYFRGKVTYMTPELLNESGLGTFDLFVTKGFTLPADQLLDLRPGTTFSVGSFLSGSMTSDFIVDSPIRTPGGKILLSGTVNLKLGAGAVLDAAGQWVNDVLGATPGLPPRINGGEISIGVASVTAGDGVRLDVSGGGWLRMKNGKQALSVGNAGIITLPGLSAADIQRLDMRAYAAGAGGTLRYNTTASVQLGGPAPALPSVLHLPATLYGERGFRTVQITAGAIAVPDNAVVQQRPVGIDLNGVALHTLPSGASLAETGVIGALPLDQRATRPPELNLTAGAITIGTGAVVRTDHGGKISLSNPGLTSSITVRGTIEAPAGAVTISTSGTLLLGATARLLALGAPVIVADVRGIRSGYVADGGSVSLSSSGKMIIEQGAVVDVSGASGEVDIETGGTRSALRLAGNGGAINIAMRGFGSTVDGTLLGHAGGAGALGGSLTISDQVTSGGPSRSSSLPSTAIYWAHPVTGVVQRHALGTNTPLDVDIRDAYPGAVQLTASMRSAINSLPGFVSAGMVVSATEGDTPGGAIMLKPWEVNSAIDARVVDLINQYFWQGTGTGASARMTTKLNILDVPLLPTTRLAASSISKGGFGAVSLNAGSGGLKFENGVNIALPGSLSISAPVIGNINGGSAQLAAKYMSLGGNYEAQANVASLAGTLRLSAHLIDLNQAVVRGFADTVLQATDIRINRGIVGNKPVAGSLDVQGRLTLTAAQVYPTTGSPAVIKASDKITVEPNGTAALPFSAGGMLTLEAPVIEQRGVLRAPFGQITLKATQSLTLAAGSETSVSGEGLILPYGSLLNNEHWFDPRTNSTSYLAAPPEKRIVLDAPNVDLASGSVINISGGGDLHAAEFVPGPGGSRNILARPGTYGILPDYASQVGPAGTGLPAGERIWLAGGNGLAPGWYTLLPANYALLPGAYAITMVSGSTGNAIDRPISLSDGSSIIAGYRGNPLYGSNDARKASWRVMSGQVLRTYTEYNEAFANTYFASEGFKLTQYRLTGVQVVTPRLAGDGGSLVLKATQQLILEGQLRAQAIPGGRGGVVDIAGTKIAVLGAGQPADALRADGYLVIDAGKLTRFGAESLLIGGTRTGDPKGVKLDVTASSVVLRNDAASELTGPEIILAASGNVEIGAGSVIAARGTLNGTDGDLIVTPQHKAVYVDPEGFEDNNPADDILVTPARDYGALVRLANGTPMKVVRQNVDITTGGVVTIGEGARLIGGRALLIDATRNTVLAASAELSGDALSVASGRIGFGGGTQGLVLSAQTLARLARTERLTLRSYSSIDFYGSVDFGRAGLKTVTLDAGSLVGYAADAVTVTGATIGLENNAASFAEPTGAGNGALVLSARELVLGTGNKAVRGFSSVTLRGDEMVVGEDTGSFDAGSAAVTLATPVLTGRRGAQQSVKTSAGLTVVRQGQGLVLDAEQSLGARLSLTGGSVHFAGHVLARGGAIELTATNGSVVVAEGSRIDVGGFAKQFFDVTAYADAGRIALTAVGGDIDLRPTAVLDLAAAGGGNAGKLSLTAAGGGTVRLGGSIAAHAGAGGAGGSFTLDIADLPDFGAFNATLTASGFSASRQFRVRDGDVVVDGFTQVGDFGLVADHGSVTVTGTVAALAPYGGRISMSAGNGLAMEPSALLVAGTTAGDGLGSGRVTLEATGGQLDLRGGVIDVRGGEGGRVRLRALQTAGHDDIQVANVRAQILGARSAVLEGVSVYDIANHGGSFDLARAQAIADAGVFANQAATIAARTNIQGVTVMPGIEIRSAGDMTVGSDWNLLTDFAGSREGGLTLRAGGNLIIKGHISDGFDRADRTGVLQDTASWDLRLVAGADLSSASALAVKPAAELAPGSGSLVVGDATAGKQVRTGTGDLVVRVGRDVDLANADSVIYTAGRRDMTTWSDFTSVPIVITSEASTGNDALGQPATYGIMGGHLDIAANGNVNAALPANEAQGQLFAEWLGRMGTITQEGYFGTMYQAGQKTFKTSIQQASWWVYHSAFKQGVGALGGGNVTVNAGGDLINLLVALPTNGRVRGGRSAGEARVLEMRNGGAMTVEAGGAIRAGRYYVGRGSGSIVAGELVVGRTVFSENTQLVKTFYPVAPILALGDATLTVRTAGEMTVQTVTDPLLHEIDRARLGGNTPLYFGQRMSGYTERSAIDLASVGGDVTLVGQTTYIARSCPNGCTDRTYPQIGWGDNVYPAKTSITAFNGSIINQVEILTTPAVQGELRLAAENDIVLGTVRLARANPLLAPSPLNPMGAWMNNTNIDRVSEGIDLAHVAADDEPSRIYARSGSVLGAAPVQGVPSAVNLISHEQIWIQAGTDIRHINGRLRNLHRTDVSLIEADNDIINATLDVEGPGAIVLQAGRDIYGAVSVMTRGNRQFDTSLRPVANTEIGGLPLDGAAISVLAGVGKDGPDYDALMARYLDPTKVADMASYLRTDKNGPTPPIYVTGFKRTGSDGEVLHVRGLIAFVAEVTGEVWIDPVQAWQRFRALPTLTQQRFVREVYMQEMRLAGRDQKVPGEDGMPLNGGYNRAHEAISTLFPGSAWKGDVKMTDGIVRTMSGGDIDVLTPGGGLQVAALGAPALAGSGLLTLGQGDIRVFAHKDVVLNRSRALTFAGGDEIFWSTKGDIDAGRGAKTVRLTSAPDIVTDQDGVTRVRERPNVSGAGIGTVAAFEGVKPGDVDLYAPEGTINAGDAGVRVSGNLFIGALRILNADNFQVSGKIKGLPEKEAAPAPLSVETKDKAAADAVRDATQQATPTERPSVIIVEILGYGGSEGNERPQEDERSRARSRESYDPSSKFRVIGEGELTEAQKGLLTAEERSRL